jgi:hypothetical protein
MIMVTAIAFFLVIYAQPSHTAGPRWAAQSQNTNPGMPLSIILIGYIMCCTHWPNAAIVLGSIHQRALQRETQVLSSPELLLHDNTVHRRPGLDEERGWSNIEFKVRPLLVFFARLTSTFTANATDMVEWLITTAIMPSSPSCQHAVPGV